MIVYKLKKRTEVINSKRELRKNNETNKNSKFRKENKVQDKENSINRQCT